mmetsp:Transcript_23753/g.60746  ORF Transcript_23753/g.60746 Transcript_23753/m.60746 type:complete len:279 (-) Transcript_23753:122-958(-)
MQVLQPHCRNSQYSDTLGDHAAVKAILRHGAVVEPASELLQPGWDVSFALRVLVLHRCTHGCLGRPLPIRAATDQMTVRHFSTLFHCRGQQLARAAIQSSRCIVACRTCHQLRSRPALKHCRAAAFFSCRLRRWRHSQAALRVLALAALKLHALHITESPSVAHVELGAVADVPLAAQEHGLARQALKLCWCQSWPPPIEAKRLQEVSPPVPQALKDAAAEADATLVHHVRDEDRLVAALTHAVTRGPPLLADDVLESRQERGPAVTIPPLVAMAGQS